MSHIAKAPAAQSAAMFNIQPAAARNGKLFAARS